jgi:hypothetical protein
MAANLGQNPSIINTGLYATLVETVANIPLTGATLPTIMGVAPTPNSIVALMAQTGGTGNGTYLYTVPSGTNYVMTPQVDLSTTSTVKGQRILQTGVSAASNTGVTYTWFVTATGTVSFTALQTEGSGQVTKAYATAPTDIVANATAVVTVLFTPDVWTSIVEKTIRVYLDGGATPAPLVVIACDTTQAAGNGELLGIRLSLTNAGTADLVGVVAKIGVTGTLSA